MITADIKDELVLREIVHLLPQADKGSALASVQAVNVNCFNDHFYDYTVERADEFKLVQTVGTFV